MKLVGVHLRFPPHHRLHPLWDRHLHVLTAQLQALHGHRQRASVFCSCAHPHAELCGLWSEEHGGQGRIQEGHREGNISYRIPTLRYVQRVGSAAQSCPTLCGPMDCSPPGSSAHRIFQARRLEWVAFPKTGDLPEPGIELCFLHWQVDSLSLAPPGKSS